MRHHWQNARVQVCMHKMHRAALSARQTAYGSASKDGGAIYREPILLLVGVADLLDDVGVREICRWLSVRRPDAARNRIDAAFLRTFLSALRSVTRSLDQLLRPWWRDQTVADGDVAVDVLGRLVQLSGLLQLFGHHSLEGGALLRGERQPPDSGWLLGRAALLSR